MTQAPPPLVVPHATGRYAVATDALAALPGYLAAAGVRPGPALVVTDTTVEALHGRALAGVLGGAGFAPRVLAVAPGEGAKALGVLHGLYDAALAGPLDRATPVFAFGGGVVGDLGGFLAATLLRGLPLVHLPTTLLAQVDSSLGGKTGVNHARGKNLIGAVYAPALVLADPALLATLPPREVASGLAEAVKHALLADADLVGWFERHLGAALAAEPAALAHVVARAQRVKAAVVAEDEFERGPRALLNFGHTFAHAFEALLGYDGRLTHGEAVAHGMRAALRLSARYAPALPLGRLDALVARLPAPPLPPLAPDAVLAAMQADKKRTADGLRFVLLRALGDAHVRDGVPAEAVVAALGDGR